MTKIKKIKLEDIYAYDPRSEILDIEYDFNEISIPFHRIRDYLPKFSFKYLAFNSTEYCFNNPSIEKEDYEDLLLMKKEISNISYDSLDRQKQHFHCIDESKPRKLLIDLFSEYIKKYRIEKEAIPDFYQFAGSHNPDKPQRVIGFLGELGVFNIVWFDFNHKVYPTKYIN